MNFITPTVHMSRSRSSSLTYLAISLGPEGRGPALPGFTPDHRYLVVPNEGSDNVSIFSLEQLRVVHVIDLVEGSRPWQAKTIPPEGRFAYISNSRFDSSAKQSTASPSTVSLIDLSIGKRVKDIPVGAGPNGITVDRSGLRGYVVNMRSHSVSVLDVRRQEVIHEISVGLAPAFAKLTMDGKLLVVTNLRSASVSIIETEKYTTIAEMQVGVPELNDSYPEWGPGDTTGIAIAADDKAYITNYRSHTVVILNLRTLETKFLSSPIQFPFFVEVDRDENLVVFSSGIEKKIAILDCVTENWLGIYPNDGSAPLHQRLRSLNLWMTDPFNNRISAILPGGIAGIAKDWNRNMVTKFM